MHFALFLFGYSISTTSAPLSVALDATEPPTSLRAAFVAELTDGEAIRLVVYDPRMPMDERWQLWERSGENEELDQLIMDWAGEVSPDSRLFADDLRASMGEEVDAEDLGAAWRLRFRPLTSENDGPFDEWAAGHLHGVAWYDPLAEQLLKVVYELPRPVSIPDGGRLLSYRHSYAIQQEPTYGVSFIAGFDVRAKGRFLVKTFERSYRVEIKKVDFFFATGEEERIFLTHQQETDLSAQDVSGPTH